MAQKNTRYRFDDSFAASPITVDPRTARSHNDSGARPPVQMPLPLGPSTDRPARPSIPSVERSPLPHGNYTHGVPDDPE